MHNIIETQFAVFANKIKVYFVEDFPY